MFSAEEKSGTTLVKNSGIAAYEMVVIPDEATSNIITSVQLEFMNILPGLEKHLAEPVISVFTLNMQEELEDTLIRWMHRIVSGKQSFWVTLNNLGAISPDQVYLRVMDQAPLRILSSSFRALEGFLKSVSPEGLQFGRRSFLPLFGNLSPSMQDRFMREYGQRLFFERFKVEKLVFRKMKVHEEKAKIITAFYLLP